MLRDLYQMASLVHELDGNRVMLAFSCEKRKKALKVSGERGRGSLELDIIVVTGTHFISCVVDVRCGVKKAAACSWGLHMGSASHCGL